MVVSNISDAKTHLSALVNQALAGEEVVIARAGKPAVKLTPVETKERRRPGSMRGEIWIADDFDEFGPELAEMFGLDGE